MSYQCETKKRSTQHTLAIRTRTSVEELGDLMGQAYGRLGQYMGELGEAPAGAPYSAYYNEDMEDLDVEIGFPVARELPGRGDIQAGQIPGVRYAACVHVGPYSEIGAAYEALSEWMEEHGYQPDAPAYEFYLNDPQETPSSELMTEVMFPLQS